MNSLPTSEGQLTGPNPGGPDVSNVDPDLTPCYPKSRVFAGLAGGTSPSADNTLTETEVEPVAPRRKRRSAEVRNSLRLFGLLTVLAGVNVYVFFFNRGTAPREVLKPSSMVREIGGKAASVNEATDQARAALVPQPAALVDQAAPAAASKSKLPVPVAPVTGTNKSLDKNSKSTVASGGGPPKGSPGGSPGQDQGSAGSPTSSSKAQESGPDSTPQKQFGESDTLGQVLAREGFEGQGARVAAALSRLTDPRLIRGGQSYAIRFDEQGEPDAFEYRPNPATHFVVSKGDSGAWIATRVDQAIDMKIVATSGTVDSTLYESVQAAGEGSALAGLLVELLAWDVNFYTDTHPGDHWKVVVEKQFLGGKFYRYGHLLGAEYGGRVGTFRAFYWKSNRPNVEGHYFDEKGQAIAKTLLKTPLRYVRISSKFDRHRFHPILHREKAHLGIDYAAPVGTPVWASSGGKVIACEMMRGSGNTVVLGHGNGMTTRYYHLSRFARGLKKGQSVRQKDVIGFVGTTGLSTGPHLHFSVTKNGAFVDPNKVQINRDAPVADRGSFLAAMKPRLATLRGLEPGALARN
jgi:murein DD-endopeptidase MepM/ murein hydrolase activator NlpD